MTTVPTDQEGYVVDPADWSEAWALEQARAQGLELTEDHWEALQFMRGFLEQHRVAPDSRFVIRHLTQTRGRRAIGCSSCFPTVTSDRPASSRECGAHAPGAPADPRAHQGAPGAGREVSPSAQSHISRPHCAALAASRSRMV